MTNETETKTPYFRMVAVGPAKEAPVEGKKPRPEVEASAKLLTEAQLGKIAMSTSDSKNETDIIITLPRT